MTRCDVSRGDLGGTQQARYAFSKITIYSAGEENEFVDFLKFQASTLCLRSLDMLYEFAEKINVRIYDIMKDLVPQTQLIIMRFAFKGLFSNTTFNACLKNQKDAKLKVAFDNAQYQGVTITSIMFLVMPLL
ncbi:hypothetical protein L596_016068 [Steinernema carpocapsae]|uniref:Uncharacterized protein n=1 Tax=Steinernema carpocapsae TaxID=34508 RepID=A0A4U5NH04_STECR|nr:hypothetical protein L596_016068 [Steinernema carpocapsae]